MAENEPDPQAILATYFSCNICSRILHDPVQCVKNEHYFCRECITKRLEFSRICPKCLDHLQADTLRPPSRIVANVVAKMKKPRCSHVSRGCKENVRVEELMSHEQACGYAPVVCLNEGCEETVNRRDKEGHETEECKFRKMTCESCGEEMVYGLYQSHLCTLREEMEKVNLRLKKAINVLKEISDTQENLQGKLEACGKIATTSEKPMTSLVKKLSSMRLASPLTTPLAKKDTTGPSLKKAKIFIVGDSDTYFDDAHSLEVFDCSTKTWTLHKECLLEGRCNPIVFRSGTGIMIYGGHGSRKVECLSPNESGFSSSQLPGSAQRFDYNDDYNGVACGNRIITFYRNVVETKLESPYTSRILIGESFTRLACSVVTIGNSVYITGGQPSTMERYDIERNRLERLSPVPYYVTRMATVAFGDNIIILGGEDDCRRPLKDVMMFNVISQEYKRLPPMLVKRACCAAVIMDDVIVVMGGGRRNRKNAIVDHLRSVECYVMGQETWHEMPEMNMARACSAAVVYE